MRFITRVPETIKAVKALYQTISTEAMQPALLDGYRYLSVDSTYGGVPQRWLVVYSDAASHREVATLEKKIAKAQGVAETSFKRLQHKTFDTYSAAEAAVADISKSWKYHQPCATIISVPHYTKLTRVILCFPFCKSTENRHVLVPSFCFWKTTDTFSQALLQGLIAF